MVRSLKVLLRIIDDIGSFFYRTFCFPFVRTYLEIKTKSIIRPGTFIRGETVLCGKNHIDRGATLSHVYLGFGSVIARNSVADNLEVGKFCSIGPDFKTVLGDHPITKFVSTHPGFCSKDTVFPAKYAKENMFEENIYTNEEKGYQVTIGNDVWTGAGVQVLHGVHIGDGAVIATGAVVTKDVEPYAIYGGVPAKKIKMRFSDEEIEKLLEIKWWDKDEKWLYEHVNDMSDVKVLIEKYEKGEL